MGCRRPVGGFLCLALLASCQVEYDVTLYDSTEIFYQEPAPLVDILFVVDNSGSMAHFQSVLAEEYGAFTTFLEEAGVDYQIGVTTTTVLDPADTNPVGCDETDFDAMPDPGELYEGVIITPQTIAASGIFSTLVQVGTCGSGIEMGLHAAWLALTEPMVSTANAGFLREEASLSLIFITDEDDSSPLSVSGYLDAFFELKGQRARDVFNASALTVVDADDCTVEQTENPVPGTRYRDVAERSDGITGDICLSGFNTMLTEFSLNASRLKDTFFLQNVPAVGSLVLSVDGVVIEPCGVEWTYDLVTVGDVTMPAIIFDREHLPPAASEIAIQYFHGDGDPEAFCADGGAQ